MCRILYTVRQFLMGSGGLFSHPRHKPAGRPHCQPVHFAAVPFQSNALCARFWLLLKTKLDAKATATITTTTRDKRKNCNANLIRF